MSMTSLASVKVAEVTINVHFKDVLFCFVISYLCFTSAKCILVWGSK